MSEAQVDIKKLIVSKLKEEGMDIAEDTAIALAKAIFKIMPEVVSATPNKFDDMLIPVLGVLQPKIIELLDKIDGEEG